MVELTSFFLTELQNSASPTSPGRAACAVPGRSESAAWRRGESRAVRRQDAPAAAKDWAIARPMPRELPVMSALLPRSGVEVVARGSMVWERSQ